jgi:VCBS repeat-containing protein/predicted outer membrane repeat protein
MEPARVRYLPLILLALLVGCGGDDASSAGGTGGSNSAPTQILLSAGSVSECAPADTLIGTLTVSDPDAGDTHTLELLTNTDKFAVISSELRTVGSFDFEANPSHDVVVRATDAGGLTNDETITITVIDELEVSSMADAGPGTLRELLTSAPPGSTICVESNVFGTITVTSGVISVSNALTLVGPGASTLTVSGGDMVPILEVKASGDLTLSGITLANALGRAVTNEGTLTLSDSVVKDSTAALAFGRASCLTSTGTLFVDRVTFSGCSAFNAGAVEIDAGSAAFQAVTFFQNSTTGNSGAAMIAGASADVSVTNSTFSGNFTTGANRVGGAIAVFGDLASGSLLLRHNTFFGNSATGDGGALYLASGTTAQVEGNLFEGNTGVGGPDIFVDPTATITSLGYNLLEDGTDSGLTDGVNNDIVGASAMLGPLADNGGPTLTHRPDPASPARDAIPSASCSVALDQRGDPRPVGGACDIGSVEF